MVTRGQVDARQLVEEARPAVRAFTRRIGAFLRTRVDPVAIDSMGDYPKHVIDGLAGLGAFGMTIPTEYGGLGLTHREYDRVNRTAAGSVRLVRNAQG